MYNHVLSKHNSVHAGRLSFEICTLIKIKYHSLSFVCNIKINIPTTHKCKKF